eukprot:CAMPEP_0115303342 /NCGR_PEP_ID=MMETSP0270-20121206/70870_1 /TAXON_ID=71861 /ORGANISM="Scrippsiella trochoidea, Strain CCMP3099" /LENGTH=131 /DNA_ID=CAMNT_0002721339 /DNA_START=330 /DNA_END=725 /DNA_ORIENTATION=+
MVVQPETCKTPRGGRRLIFLFSRVSTTGTAPMGAPLLVRGTVTTSIARNQSPSESLPDNLRYLADLRALPLNGKRDSGEANKTLSHLLKSSKTSLPNCPRKDAFSGWSWNIASQDSEAISTFKSVLEASTT